MNIAEAEMWSCAFSIAEALMMGWEGLDSDVLFRAQYMIMSAYVEGVRDAKNYPESPS